MIKIKDLKKKFDGRWVTNGLNLEIPIGKMTVIIGKSGEGKSVLLKQIIGLIEPTSGTIMLDTLDLTELAKTDPSLIFEKFGYVFQFAALLDSLNVYENIAITLLERGLPKDEILPSVKKLLQMVNLPEDVLYKNPSELSGGMKKRVGLARTLLTSPQIILYDEPTTGLDPITSRVIHELMLATQKEFNLTSIVVSHDVEIFKYADYVALLSEGKIQYHGDAKTVWESDNPFIYQFIRGLTEGPIKTEIPQNPR